MGGAIALGHPLGATGAIRAATVVHALRRNNLKYGMVTMCVGTGMGAAGIFERCKQHQASRTGSRTVTSCTAFLFIGPALLIGCSFPSQAARTASHFRGARKKIVNPSEETAWTC